MIKSIKQRGYEIIFISDISNERSKIMDYVLVDNMDLAGRKLFDTIHNIDEVASNIQDAINTWKGLLKTTGRAIRLDKSFIYSISF